ncbi:hypothetical protein MMC31_005982, partial [Peltigera leucophlebia]|nr:hypothetical protein [Peltigera leucophlebia]
MPPYKKRQRSATPLASTAVSPTSPDQTPTKRPRVALPALPTPLKGKAGAAISRAIAGSSRPIPLNSRPSQIELPPYDKIWLVFGDLDSSQYLKSATTHEEYTCLAKYFYGRLVLVVRGLHLPEVRAIFRSTVPPWYNSADTEIQDDMENQFESAHDWANQEVQKKICLYSYAWTQTPAGKAYTSAWVEAKTNKSSRYPYPEDPKNPEDMLSTRELASVQFERANVIDFWMVRFAAIETEKTPAKNMVGWLKTDKDDEGDIYDLTVAAMMRSVPTFSLQDIENSSKKYELVCRSGQNPLFLEDLVPCPCAYRGIEKDGKAIEAPEIPENREAESPLTISSPQLRPGIRAAESLCVALVQPPESRFSASPGLSDIDHICRHACAVISMEKEFDFSPGPYRLDTLSPPVLVPEVVDEVACRYSRLPLERADAFHVARIEQEIARLDIIVSKAANRASTLKAALAWATKQKSKYKEQLELIRTIQANNIMMEEKIKA